jgi:hypothetical protein
MACIYIDYGVIRYVQQVGCVLNSPLNVIALRRAFFSLISFPQETGHVPLTYETNGKIMTFSNLEMNRDDIFK